MEQPALYTKRLRLEPLCEAHADAIFEAQQDPSIYSYIPQDPLSRDDLRKRFRFLQGAKSPDGTQHWLNWTAFLRDTQTPVGRFEATVEQGQDAAIGYSVFSAHWRKGFAGEMGRCLISNLFEVHGTSHLVAEIDTRNVASIRLVESWGFVRVGLQKDADFFKGQTSDELRYRLSLEAWRLGAMG